MGNPCSFSAMLTRSFLKPSNHPYGNYPHVFGDEVKLRRLADDRAEIDPSLPETFRRKNRGEGFCRFLNSTLRQVVQLVEQAAV